MKLAARGWSPRDVGVAGSAEDLFLGISAEINLQLSRVSVSRAAGFGVGEGKTHGTKECGKQFGAVLVQFIPVDDHGYRTGPASGGCVLINGKDARNFDCMFDARYRRILLDVSGKEIDV